MKDSEYWVVEELGCCTLLVELGYALSTYKGELMIHIQRMISVPANKNSFLTSLIGAVLYKVKRFATAFYSNCCLHSLRLNLHWCRVEVIRVLARCDVLDTEYKCPHSQDASISHREFFTWANASVLLYYSLIFCLSLNGRYCHIIIYLLVF